MMTVAEKNVLAAKGATGVRLSCQVRVIDDLHVRVIRQASVEGIEAGGRPVD